MMIVMALMLPRQSQNEKDQETWTLTAKKTSYRPRLWKEWSVAAQGQNKPNQTLVTKTMRNAPWQPTTSKRKTPGQTGTSGWYTSTNTCLHQMPVSIKTKTDCSMPARLKGSLKKPTPRGNDIAFLADDKVEDIMTSKPMVDGRRALQAAEVAEHSTDLSIAQYWAARDMFLEYQLKVFITKLCPLVDDDKETTLKIFLKSGGVPFQKGTIGRRVTAFVMKSGIRPNKLVFATDFHKWLVMELKRKKRMGIPIDEGLLRRLTCHSDKTANEWYLCNSLTQEAAAASTMIEEHTKPSSSKATLSSSKDPAPSAKEDLVVSSPKGDLPADDKALDQPSTSSHLSHPSSGKISLTSEQHCRIEKVFSEDLQQNLAEEKESCSVN